MKTSQTTIQTIKNKGLIILGIDPGIADMGYGVIEKNHQGKIIHICHGSIKTSAGLPFPTRLLEASQQLEKVINEYRPEIVGVEEIFFFKNVKTVINVSQARGVVILAAAKNGLDVCEFTPLEVKQAISAYGRADKKQVQKMVQLILNLKEIPKPDDAADALAVAICASQIKNLSF